MNDGDAAARDQRTPSAAGRWKTILFAVLVLVGLGGMTAIGSLLVNVDWPEGPWTWLKTLFGGLLLTIVALVGTPAVKPVMAAIKGNPKGDNERHNLDSVERIAGHFTPRRIFLAIVLASALFLTAAVLPSIRPPEARPALEPGPIRVISAIDESPRDSRFMLIEQWNAAHPENRVELTTVSGETDAQHAAMVNAAKGRRADVFLLDIVWMPEFIAQHYIRPLDEEILVDYADDQFLANALGTCRDSAGGRDGLWGLPFNSDAGLLYYRSDLGAILPRTWEDYFGAPAAATLAEVRGTPERGAAATRLAAANAAQFANDEVLTVTALEAMWAADGEVVNRSGKVVLSPDESMVEFDSDALAGLRNLAAAVRNDDIALDMSPEANESAARSAFKEGRTMFMRNWPVAHDRLLTSGGEKAIPFDVTTLPGTSVLGGQNLAISGTTERPRAAQAFIEFLTSPSSQLTLFEVGGFAPTRPSAYVNSRRPYGQDLRTAIERARPRPALVDYTEFSRVFREGIWLALNNGGELGPDLARKLARLVT